MEWHEREMVEGRVEWEIGRAKERCRESDKGVDMRGRWERVGWNGKQEDERTR
jgi:hypothetical protein